MGKINWGRVLLGGVLFAVVYNIIVASAWFLFLRDGWLPALAALGPSFQKSPEMLESMGFRGLYLLLTLAAGIFAIWLYAAIRPRYGPGPKTAAGAGLALWVGGVLLPTLAWDKLVPLPGQLVASDLTVMLIAAMAATIVGAWPYQEGPTGA